MEGIIFDWMGTLYERNKGLFPNSKSVLEELSQRYKLGLVSIAKNGVEARRKQLESCGILNYFSSVIVDTEKTLEHYIRCMEEMGTSPRTTAIVDDRIVRGIMIGNQLGCLTFWVQKGEYAHEVPDKKTGEPNCRIDSIEDLLKIL